MPEGCSISLNSEGASAATSTQVTAGMRQEQPLKASMSPTVPAARRKYTSTTIKQALGKVLKLQSHR